MFSGITKLADDNGPKTFKPWQLMMLHRLAHFVLLRHTEFC